MKQKPDTECRPERKDKPEGFRKVLANSDGSPQKSTVEEPFGNDHLTSSPIEKSSQNDEHPSPLASVRAKKGGAHA